MATAPTLPAGVVGTIGAVTAGTALVSAFLVTLQKINYDVQDAQNVSFLFNYREEDTTDFKSDITDHYTESNTSIQDQIALKPISVTLHGFMGELNDQKSGIAAEVQLIASQLTVFAPYVPQLTVAALALYNEANEVYQTAAAASAVVTQAYNGLTGSNANNPLTGLPLSKQQYAYNFFKSRWQARMLFTVQTPWDILQNMAIEDFHAVQEGESSTWSDFRITFKQMNFAQVATSLNPIQALGQARNAAQSAIPTQQGVVNPNPTTPLSSSLP